MYRQLEPARSGAALFGVRGKCPRYVIMPGVAITCLHGASGPFVSNSANLAWYYIGAVTLLAYITIRGLYHFNKTFDGIY